MCSVHIHQWLLSVQALTSLKSLEVALARVDPRSHSGAKKLYVYLLEQIIHTVILLLILAIEIKAIPQDFGTVFDRCL